MRFRRPDPAGRQSTGQQVPSATTPEKAPAPLGAGPAPEGAQIRAERAALLADRSCQGRPFSEAYSALADSWLVSLLAGERDVALVAVGGYGRQELCPASDIDVLLIHANRSDVRRLAERLWYPLWDAGLDLGHSVRTVKEALSLASSDLDTATSLLDTRFVAGDPALAAALRSGAAGAWRNRSARFLEELGRFLVERHARAGEVAFLLEPDLKEGRGGLRDVHSARWAGAAQRIVIDGGTESLERAHDVLLAVRVELHRRTGRHLDRLLLQEQDALAEDLALPDADTLMANVARAARTIAWASDELWDRLSSSLRGPAGRVSSSDRPLGAGLVLREGLVELVAGTEPRDDPSLALRAAAAAATAGARLSPKALNLLEASPPTLPDPWPEEALRALLRLLGAGRTALVVLEALDQRGLLVAMIPEWEAVRYRPQRNAYHRFTVDRHLWETAAEAARLAPRVRRPDLLLIAALLHDLGKGFPGDHSVVGGELAEQVSSRLGFDDPDRRVLVTLVRHHLLLADVATRRDLADPATAAGVAAVVGDGETLALLAALTEADSVATGHVAWGPWKAALVGELVSRTAALLDGEAHRPHGDHEGPDADELALLDRARAEKALVLEATGPLLRLVATDRPGLFCRVAGTLSLHGLDILAARAWTSSDGLALEWFRVESVLGPTPDWDAVEADLRRALTGRLSIEARLAERARAYAGRRRRLAAGIVKVRIEVDNLASEVATVVEVRAPDEIGTLYRITRALAELDLDVRSAKVSSIGPELIDAFYVVDAAGAKITDPEQVGELQKAVRAHLDAR